MKKILTIGLLMSGLTSAFSADCSSAPVSIELTKAIEAKDIAKAKKLLEAFKTDVQAYLKQCGKSKEKFEETSVMILTYEDRLADVEYDLNAKPEAKVDCSKVPSDKALNAAFKSADASKIKAEYAIYKKESEGYLEHCTAHEEYEFVFEAWLLDEEEYLNWEKSKK